MKIYFGWKSNAGLIAIYGKKWTLQIGVRRAYWTWSEQRSDDSYGITTDGYGPLYLFTYNLPKFLWNR